MTVDANHPLAGKTVTLRIKVLDVRIAPAVELSGKVFLNPGTLQ